MSNCWLAGDREWSCLYSEQVFTQNRGYRWGGRSRSYLILNYFAKSYFILKFLRSYLTNMVIKVCRSNHTSYLIFGPNHTSYLFFYPNHTKYLIHKLYFLPIFFLRSYVILDFFAKSYFILNGHRQPQNKPRSVFQSWLWWCHQILSPSDLTNHFPSVVKSLVHKRS